MCANEIWSRIIAAAAAHIRVDEIDRFVVLERASERDDQTQLAEGGGLLDELFEAEVLARVHQLQRRIAQRRLEAEQRRADNRTVHGRVGEPTGGQR